jgi:hypothetical protein
MNIISQIRLSSPSSEKLETAIQSGRLKWIAQIEAIRSTQKRMNLRKMAVRFGSCRFGSWDL